MTWFLDSSVYIYFDRKMFEAIAEKLMATSAEDIKIPSMVVAELLYGAEKSARREFNLPRLRRFLALYEIVPFDAKAADCYRFIRSDLERGGRLIGPNDIVIAATVLSRSGILVTHNTSEFSRVKNLALEDWTNR
ncbi:MAG: PIN domain-containing protein [Synergistaceae bacterium]|jgi:tRNA(fMet)-specific endonuclease VapC|nr:PIN domain-containing protein [Synergistaceae bacterium]